MHSIGIVHTDLKPENILLMRDQKFVKFKDKSTGKKYNLPRDMNIKLIDFGNAVLEDEEDCLHTSTINTRQFRAPEVTLKCGEWDSKSDVWGIGCIILELISGALFFATHSTYEHLAMIEKACGPVPANMIKINKNRDWQKYFELCEQRLEIRKTYLRWPEGVEDEESIAYVDQMEVIENHVPSNEPELRD